MIIASLVVIPSRTQVARLIIPTLVEQCDKVYVHAPYYFQVKGAEFFHHAETDLVDQMKFDVPLDGVKYHLTCDDDICYPRDYVARMIDCCASYDDKVVVGVHGSTFYSEVSDYFKDKTTRHFTHYSVEHACHALGTGTLCYSPQLVQFPQTIFTENNMADIFVNRKLNDLKIPRICIGRKSGWLTCYETEDNLYLKYKDFHPKHNELIRGITWTK